MDVEVQYQGQQTKLPVIVEGDGPSLFRRDWLSAICIDWKSINMVKSKRLTSVLDKHQVLFADGLSTLKAYEAKIIVELRTQPRFCKGSPVPNALKDRLMRSWSIWKGRASSPPYSLQTGQRLLSQ